MDNVTRLQEQIDRAIQEHRYEDIPDLENAILTEQGDVQHQRDLTVTEKRWDDAARFHDVITDDNAKSAASANYDGVSVVKHIWASFGDNG